VTLSLTLVFLCVNAPSRVRGLRTTCAARLRLACFAHAPRLSLRYLSATRAELGLAGEELAARSLLRTGWRLRGRRVKTQFGEVDLWATLGRVSLVVEVKTGRLRYLPQVTASSTRWDLRWRPGESLSTRQRGRLIQAAQHLAKSNGDRAQLSIIEVFVSRDGSQVEVLAPRALASFER
jgi:Holliday junction resolvase-like predicted endonuclease